MTRRKGRGSVVLTASIIVTAIALVMGWTWHSFPGYEVEPGVHVVEKAFYENQSDLMVEVTGQVVRLMEREKTNPRYQEFQMRLPNGQLLLVLHKNGIRQWIPLKARHQVTVRGNYQWTELGGIVRDTQRDHSMERRHGWVEYEGKRYD